MIQSYFFVRVQVLFKRSHKTKAKITLTSPIVMNVPTRASLAVETKGLLFLWLAHLNNKSNVCKKISSLYVVVLVCVNLHGTQSLGK